MEPLRSGREARPGCTPEDCLHACAVLGASRHLEPVKTEHCREAAATGSLTQAVQGVYAAVLGQLRHIVAPVIDGGPKACRREMESTCRKWCAAPALPRVRPQTSSDPRAVRLHCNWSRLVHRAAATTRSHKLHASMHPLLPACTTDAHPPTVDEEHCGPAVPRRQPVDVVPPPLPAVPACMKTL